MFRKFLIASTLLLSMSLANAVPVTVTSVTDFYSDTENGWLIFSGPFDAALTDLTTDVVASNGLTATAALEFSVDGLDFSTTITDTFDLGAGVYTLFLFDSFGDGMTCEDAFCSILLAGGFTLSIDGFEAFNNLGQNDFGQVFHEFEITAAAVSEPSLMALLGMGLVGFGFNMRRRKV